MVPPMPTDETSAAAVTRLAADGYDGTFFVRPGGMLECAQCGAVFDASRARIDQIRIFEGNEDPDDREVVVAITCVECGEQGTLVLGYGSAANPDDLDVLAKLDDQTRR
jgi:hypothetical protein